MNVSAVAFRTPPHREDVSVSLCHLNAFPTIHPFACMLKTLLDVAQALLYLSFFH